ncbi:MAG: alpha-N-arabinofuranosidase [bacterium]
MARIKIDPERRVGGIDRNIYGNFIEHLGRCIYGGIYEEGSHLSDERGFRRDVVEAVRALKVPVLRWPGGNFVSGYHWQDGIGPKDARPRRLDLAWNTVETNRFGTDEFVEYCREVEAEPYICVNLGNGTAEEASNWVDYCNGARNTHYADLRRKNGREEPYGVKYWGLGNEIYGHWQIGHKDAVDYAKEALEFAKVMRWTDPTISLIAVGEGRDPEWNLEVVRRLARHIDYLSLHLYVGNDDYYDTVASAAVAEREIELMGSAIEMAKFEAGVDRPIKIAFDEWNVWYRESGNAYSPETYNRLEERYNLRDALVVATFLNAFQRHCRTVTMANMAQLVNVIAPIFTSPQGLFLQTIYFPLKLYAEHCGEVALDVLVESDVFSTVDAKITKGRPNRLRDVPYLDVAASIDDKSRKLSLAVVNRHRDEGMETLVEIAGAPREEADVYEINGRSVDVENSFNEPENVKIQSRRISEVKSRFTYAFPPHSVTLLKIGF